MLLCILQNIVAFEKVLLWNILWKKKRNILWFLLIIKFLCISAILNLWSKLMKLITCYILIANAIPSHPGLYSKSVNSKFKGKFPVTKTLCNKHTQKRKDSYDLSIVVCVDLKVFCRHYGHIRIWFRYKIISKWKRNLVSSPLRF